MFFNSASTLLAIAATASGVSAVTKGYNYGATKSDGSAKTQQDFASEFSTCSKLDGTTGFSSARLYTTIQAGTASDLSGAIPAAAQGNVPVMLGAWASGGDTVVDNEIKALQAAAKQYPKIGSLCEGISIGSEDLYRNSDLGVKAKAGIGADPNTVAGYIKKVKAALKGTVLEKCPVGHVDTWTAWVNSSNNAVIDASDFIGFDAYPYFQNTMANDISKAKALFQSAYQQTVDAVHGKPIIVTESGWPVSGKTENQAEPSTKNAKTYWDEVGCGLLFDKVPTYWYTCQDALPTTPNPSFGVIGSGSTKPLYDLSCKNTTSSTTSSGTATGTATATGTGLITLTNSAGVPTGTVGAGNGTFHSTPIASASGVGPTGASGTAGASGPGVSHSSAGALAPMGGLFAAVMAFAAAL